MSFVDTEVNALESLVKMECPIGRERRVECARRGLDCVGKLLDTMDPAVEEWTITGSVSGSLPMRKGGAVGVTRAFVIAE